MEGLEYRVRVSGMRFATVDMRWQVLTIPPKSPACLPGSAAAAALAGALPPPHGLAAALSTMAVGAISLAAGAATRAADAADQLTLRLPLGLALIGVPSRINVESGFFEEWATELAVHNGGAGVGGAGVGSGAGRLVAPAAGSSSGFSYPPTLTSSSGGASSTTTSSTTRSSSRLQVALGTHGWGVQPASSGAAAVCDGAALSFAQVLALTAASALLQAAAGAQPGLLLPQEQPALLPAAAAAFEPRAARGTAFAAMPTWQPSGAGEGSSSSSRPSTHFTTSNSSSSAPFSGGGGGSSSHLGSAAAASATSQQQAGGVLAGAPPGAATTPSLHQPDGPVSLWMPVPRLRPPLQLEGLEALRLLVSGGAVVAWDAAKHKGKLGQLMLHQLELLREEHQVTGHEESAQKGAATGAAGGDGKDAAAAGAGAARDAAAAASEETEEVTTSEEGALASGMADVQSTDAGEVALRLRVHLMSEARAPELPPIMPPPPGSPLGAADAGRRWPRSGLAGGGPLGAGAPRAGSHPLSSEQPRRDASDAVPALPAMQAHLLELGVHLNLSRLVCHPAEQVEDTLCVERNGPGSASRGVLLVADLGGGLEEDPWQPPPLGFGLLAPRPLLSASAWQAQQTRLAQERQSVRARAAKQQGAAQLTPEEAARAEARERRRQQRAEWRQRAGRGGGDDASAGQ